MTDPASQINQIAPELLRAILDVLRAGYGEVVVVIADSKIDVIKKTESLKPRK